MSAKSNRQRRKRKEGSRKANDRILIIAQGSVTEIEYFNELKSLYRLPGIQIINESHSPENIVKKSKNAISREEFDKVYFVVDVDASSKNQLEQGFAQARKLSTRNRTCQFIVSTECFEVWLLAHHSKLTHVYTRATLSAKANTLGLLENKKHLAESFPFHNLDQAMKNVKMHGPNEIGSKNSTAIPHLLKAIGVMKDL
ncbi:RloB domain-containing protein [Corynebacterium striatum]|uniref:RloB domain-containing protein n=1 Tax=Corynebacterium striatum TaxID=43770 RepID=A0ABC8CL96_CORST|nr:RloB family protein [Corynebacterium striatum]ATZ08821.1 hypothetical protein A9D01_08745 [Corynebacterium striatum]EGT5612758.1 RloB domain-containing protein [Corynebacterium striatum]